MTKQYAKGTVHSPFNSQVSQSSTVYVFGNGELEEDEIVEYEMSKLRPRGKTSYGTDSDRPSSSTHTDPSYVEKTIKEGETLQSLALKFGCPVGELKRVNNLLADQDFYRLKKLKVPVKEHSMLKEMIEREEETVQRTMKPDQSRQASNHMTRRGRQQSDSSRVQLDDCDRRSDDDDDSFLDASDPETQHLIVRTLSIKPQCSNQSKEAAAFLQSMDKDIRNIVASTTSRMDSLDDVTESLTSKRIRPLQRRDRSSWNCGLTWRGVIYLVLTLFVLAPLFGGLYYYFFANTL